jgi:hypothetical protein
MPAPDAAVIAHRLQIPKALREIVPGEGVIADAGALRPYESDSLRKAAHLSHLQPDVIATGNVGCGSDRPAQRHASAHGRTAGLGHRLPGAHSLSHLNLTRTDTL